MTFLTCRSIALGGDLDNVDVAATYSGIDLASMFGDFTGSLVYGIDSSPAGETLIITIEGGPVCPVDGFADTDTVRDRLPYSLPSFLLFCWLLAGVATCNQADWCSPLFLFATLLTPMHYLLDHRPGFSLH